MQYKPQAERQVKVRLGLEKIAELEGLKPTEEETEAEYQKLADAYGMPLESVKNLVTVEGINGDIQNQKAIDLVKANAVVVEKKAEEEQAEEKKPAKKDEKKSDKKPGPFRRLRNYLGDVRSEMRRVVWPSRDELMSYSVAIIAMLIVFGIVIWLVDSGIVAALIGFTGLRG